MRRQPTSNVGTWKQSISWIVSRQSRGRMLDIPSFLIRSSLWPRRSFIVLVKFSIIVFCISELLYCIGKNLFIDDSIALRYSNSSLGFFSHFSFWISEKKADRPSGANSAANSGVIHVFERLIDVMCFTTETLSEIVKHRVNCSQRSTYAVAILVRFVSLNFPNLPLPQSCPWNRMNCPIWLSGVVCLRSHANRQYRAISNDCIEWVQNSGTCDPWNSLQESSAVYEDLRLILNNLIIFQICHIDNPFARFVIPMRGSDTMV